MPDGIRDVSQTGKVSRSELEPMLKREHIRPKSEPENKHEIGSATGIMPIYREPADDSAKRDEDSPAE